jgi:hypothetical protein
MRHNRIGLLVAVALATGGCAAPQPPPSSSPADRPVRAVLVRTTNLGHAVPPSPDTSGVTYDRRTDDLLVVDSEVEEGQFFRGANMWTLNRRGVVESTGSTLRYTKEPSGVVYNPRTRQLFVADDDNDRIFDVRAGRDKLFGTRDDVVLRTDVSMFGDSDLEDVGLDTATGELILVDAARGVVHMLGPGRDGRFDGVGPKGDDTSHSFDISRFGAADVEGLTYDAARNTILLVSHRTHYVYEVTPTGKLVTVIDISDTFDKKAAGITLAPASSGDRSTSMYIVDRGIDNNTDPTVSDGKLYELHADLPPPPRHG